jgi:hypothetical protein
MSVTEQDYVASYAGLGLEASIELTGGLGQRGPGIVLFGYSMRGHAGARHAAS